MLVHRNLRFSPLKKAVATLISAFPCKQVASLDIDRMTIWVGHPHPNGHQFKVCLLTECACSKCEPQGGENMSAELDEKYENAWHSVAQPPRR